MSQTIGDKILKALETKSMTIPEIAKATGIKHYSVSGALGKLLKERKVVNRCGMWECCETKSTLTRKQIEKLKGKEVIVYCGVNTPKKYGERSIKGKLIGVYPHIFTVKHKFIESFCYADILTREIRVVEAN